MWEAIGSSRSAHLSKHTGATVRLAKKSLSSKQAGRTPGDPSNPREGKESRPALSSRDKVMPLQLESGKGAERRIGSVLTRTGAGLTSPESGAGGRGSAVSQRFPGVARVGRRF